MLLAVGIQYWLSSWSGATCPGPCLGRGGRGEGELRGEGSAGGTCLGTNAPVCGAKATPSLRLPSWRGCFLLTGAGFFPAGLSGPDGGDVKLCGALFSLEPSLSSAGTVGKQAVWLCTHKTLSIETQKFECRISVARERALVMLHTSRTF